MKLPEPAFAVVNVIVRLLLRSPLHGLMSGSIMLISYTGRKSGRSMSTPVRYLRTDDSIICLTGQHVQWWRNVRSNSEVTLLTGGVSAAYRGEIQQQGIREALIQVLSVYPQDATYQDIRLNPDKSLNEEDLAAAVGTAVVVRFYLAQP